MKLLVLTADPNTLLCHRRELLMSLAAQGWRITAAAAGPSRRVEEFLAELGGKYVPLDFARAGMNPLQDIKIYQSFRALCREVQPDALFAYTIKSVIYGSLAAAREGVSRIYPLLCGLGYAFAEGGGIKRWMIGAISSQLYKQALAKATCVFFQNADDEALLRQRRVLPKDAETLVLPGSGVNLSLFPMSAPDVGAAQRGQMRFVLVSRMLRSKGVPEFATAARWLRQLHPDWEFHLVGAMDPGPDGVAEAELRQWEAEGLVKWHGAVENVQAHLANAHAFVLPTYYREGVPRASLEALACGRPIITTDSVGSRETIALTTKGQMQRRGGDAVMEGQNGYLVHPRNPEALAAAMTALAAHPDKLAALGARSRKLAETRFDVRLVVRAMTERIQPPTPAPRTAELACAAEASLT